MPGGGREEEARQSDMVYFYPKITFSEFSTVKSAVSEGLAQRFSSISTNQTVVTVHFFFFIFNMRIRRKEKCIESHICFLILASGTVM